MQAAAQNGDLNMEPGMTLPSGTGAMTPAIQHGPPGTLSRPGGGLGEMGPPSNP